MSWTNRGWAPAPMAAAFGSSRVRLPASPAAGTFDLLIHWFLTPRHAAPAWRPLKETTPQMPGNRTAMVETDIAAFPTERGWLRSQFSGATAETSGFVASHIANDELGRSASTSESFGARLRRLRLKRRLGQTQLAAALDVSAPAVSAWEKDRARPKHDRLDALGQLLGVSVAELLGDDVGEFSPDMLTESRAQIARIVGTTPDKIRILIEF
jgi:transcriptional regulator with XRE-family HTH domain